MSKPLFELRSLISRTTALVGSAYPKKMSPWSDDPSGSSNDRSIEHGHERELGGWRSRLPRLGFDRASVAVSVEGATLRFLTTSGGRVLGWSSMPLPDRAAHAGQINDPMALGTTLDAAFEQFQLPRGRVSWALPGFGVQSRMIDLPNVSADDVQESVAEEFDRLLGASAADYYLFWERLAGRIRQRTVFALAVPKSTVLAALEAMEVARIRPVAMDLRTIALARAVGRSDAIVTNLEEGSIDIVIVERGIPAAIRSVPIISPTVNREAIQNRLIEETERALAYFDDANPDHPLDADAPVYLTGSLANGIALTERLRAIIRHPIGRLKPEGIYPPELPLSDYAVNLGLALKRA